MGRCWQRWIVFASTRHRISRDVSLIQPKFQGQLDAIELIPSFVEASKSNFFFQRPSRSKGPTISTPSITAASVCFFFFLTTMSTTSSTADAGGISIGRRKERRRRRHRFAARPVRLRIPPPPPPPPPPPDALRRCIRADTVRLGRTL